MTTAFKEQQFEAIYPDGIEHHYWTRSRNALIRDLLRKHALHGPILEVGAGRGICTAYLRQAGCAIDGVELAPVRPIPGAENWIRPGTDALSLPLGIRQEYTALALFDIIEHIDDPGAFLKGLLDAFPNVRHVVVTVPSPPEIYSNYDAFNGHYRRYSRDLLAEHLEAAGMRTVDLEYRFKSLLPITKLILLLGRKRSTRIAPPRTSCARLLHKLATLYFYLESKTLPGSWKGTSLFAVAEIRGRNLYRKVNHQGESIDAGE